MYPDETRRCGRGTPKNKLPQIVYLKLDIILLSLKYDKFSKVANLYVELLKYVTKCNTSDLTLYSEVGLSKVILSWTLKLLSWLPSRFSKKICENARPLHEIKFARTIFSQKVTLFTAPLFCALTLFSFFNKHIRFRVPPSHWILRFARGILSQPWIWDKFITSHFYWMLIY